MINFRNIFKREIRKIPKKNSVISDLFIWRNNEDWQTKFELMNFTLSVFHKIFKTQSGKFFHVQIQNQV